MKTTIWLPLFPGDYLADTQHLSTEQHGAYLLMLMHEWTTGPLPDDDATLCRITRLTPDAWSIARAVLRGFFTVTTDGKLLQPRLEREKAKSLERKATAQEKAEKAAAARWKRDASSIPQAMHEQCPPPPPPQRVTTTKTASFDAFVGSSKFVPDEENVASIWELYPKPRGSKMAGFAAIRQALIDLHRQRVDDPATELSARVRTWFAWHDREVSKRIFVASPPHAQGWFGKRQKRYMDDESIPPPEPTLVLPNGETVRRSEVEGDGWVTIRGGVA